MAAAGLQTLAPSLSLADELKDAQQAGKPLVVMVSLDGCMNCRAERESHLLPIRAQEGLAVVQLERRSRQLTRYFCGAPTSHEERIRAWKIKLAPTLLFIGPDGA